MIKPNWEVFSAKFSESKESTFEWFAYLLFCRKYNLPEGWFGYKNQSDIEKNPIKHEGEIIGFQAKFYSTPLSTHKQDFLKMLDGAKKNYPELTKILIYTNQEWGQANNKTKNKMTSPKALITIKDKAEELGISLEWRPHSFFESEFVALDHSDLSKYFFTDEKFEGWQRFGDWSHLKTDLEKEYLIDGDVKVVVPQNINTSEVNVVDGINSIRNQLLKGGTSVRLVGLSGVGKTRFAQALFDERIGENHLDLRNVWYCDIGDSPNPQPEHFIEELIQKNKPYILIIDNCGQDTHANLTRKIQGTQLSLMTIEYDIKDDLPENTDIYKLKPISVKIVKKVIQRHYPHINDLNSYKIAEFTGGNYRLALAIASNIDKTDNLALLTDSQLFKRIFWQQGQINEKLFQVAQVFALVYSFNIEDSEQENSELNFLANLAKVAIDTAIEVIETLKNKDIVQQRGKWRAILPHALANHLAKEFVSKKLVSQIDNTAKTIPTRLQTSFIKRLSYLHDVSKIKELVDSWFSNSGWLGKKILDNSYNNHDLVHIRLLSSISEDQLLNLIQHKHDLDSKFLTRENQYFVEVSQILRTLAYQKHNFKKAFELLLYFAKDEKEDERNNSIQNLVTSLFRLYTSETLADLEQKKQVLTQLKERVEYQHILLNCISTALHFYDYGYSLNEQNETGKPSSYGYQPRSYDELSNWIEFLLNILNELDIQGIMQTRDIFKNHLKDIIWKTGSTQIVEKYLLLFNQRNYYPQAHNQILNIIKWNKDELLQHAPDILDELHSLEQRLRPRKDNISELIKSYIPFSDHEIYKMDNNSDDKDLIAIPGFNSYEEIIKFIGENIQSGTLKENLSLLIPAYNWRIEHQQIYDMGYKIANRFNNTDLWIDLLKNAKFEKSLNQSDFLLGVFKFFRQSNLSNYRILIDSLSGDTKYNDISNQIILRTCDNDDDFKYLSEFIKVNTKGNYTRLSLAWHKFKNNITDKQFGMLMDTLIEVGEAKAVQLELQDECFFQKRIDDKYINILLNHLDEVIKNASHINHFEDVLMVLLRVDSITSDKVFHSVKASFEKEIYISLNSDSMNFKILKLLIENNTSKFIEFFTEDDSFMQKFLMGGISEILAYANEEDVLIWVNNEQSKIDDWLEKSRLYKKNEKIRLDEEHKMDDIVWNDLVIDLLLMSNNKISSLNIVFDNHIFRTTGTFLGSWSQVRSRLIYIYSLRDKIESKLPELLDTIDSKGKQWLSAIEAQAKQDESEDRVQSEKFDW